MFIKNLTTDNIYLTVGLLTLIVLRTVGLRKVGLRKVGLRKVGLRLPNQPPPRLKKDNIYQCNLHADIFFDPFSTRAIFIWQFLFATSKLTRQLSKKCISPSKIWPILLV